MAKANIRRIKEAGHAAGAAAFARGVACVPALDSELGKASDLAGVTGFGPEPIAFLRGWHSGWAMASLKSKGLA